jgi:hypothetical protein
MRWFHLRRRLDACIALTVMSIVAAAFVVVPGTGAGAAVHSGPSTLIMRATLRLSIPDPANPTVPMQVSAPMPAPAHATVDANGSIVVPAAGFVFATDADPTQPPAPVLPGILDRVELRAVTDFVGAVDPSTGLLWLRGDVVATASGPTIPSCPVGPVPLTLATSNPEGLPYDQNNGSAKLTDAAFTIGAIPPGTPGCGGFEGLIALGLGLPNPPGAMLLAVDLIASPPFTGTPDSPPPPAPAPPAPSAGPSSAGHVGGTNAARPATPRSTPGATSPTAATPTPTTGYVWTGQDAFSLLGRSDESDLRADADDDGDDLGNDSDGRRVAAVPTASRTPDSDTSTAVGIGVAIGIAGVAIAAFVLLRSEAQKLLKRKRHAAF